MCSAITIACYTGDQPYHREASKLKMVETLY
jgi:hypothetical protein